MNAYSLSHLSDHILLRDLSALVARDRANTASLVAHIAEVDARRLYLSAGFPSMYACCVEELHLSEDAAFKRIQAARCARQFPILFTALADGRLHLSAVCLLAPHLTEENVGELIAAAAYRRKSEIQQLLAQRFPQPDVPTLVQAVPSQPAPGQVVTAAPASSGVSGGQLAPAQVHVSYPKISALSPERFALQFTVDRSTYDLLRYAQELLSHEVPSGDLAQVFHRALQALVGQLEKRKFAATGRPLQSPGRSTKSRRHIPAAIKRAVWERDGGRCTFVSDTGRRCPARRFLEFDHTDEVSRGGTASVERMRLRCRAHNQYGAERTFGAVFMEQKREQARRAAHAREQANEVIPWLRSLGFRADEARQAAALCETIPCATLEERVRMALSYFAPRVRAAPA